MAMTVIVSEGVEYVTISQELYNELYAYLEDSEAARFGAVENFRTWCAANKGVTTVEEGLWACTPEELQAQYYACGCSQYAGPMPNYIYWLVERLKTRRERQETARGELPVATIMPDDEEDGANGTDDH